MFTPRIMQITLICAACVLLTICVVSRRLVTAYTTPPPILVPVTGAPMNTVTSYYPVRITQIKDGDTFTADIVFPFGVGLLGQDVRAADYDAWETSKRRTAVEVTNEEVVKGKKALLELTAFLKTVDEVVGQPAPQQRDVYGRVLLCLFYKKDGQILSLADWMRDNGHIRPSVIRMDSPYETHPRHDSSQQPELR